jgi:hypothetical protein
MKRTGKVERKKKTSSVRNDGPMVIWLKKVIPVGSAAQQERRFRFWIPVFFFSCYFIFLLLYINPAIIYSSNGVNIHKYVVAMHAKNDSPDHTIHYEDPPYRHPFILELTPEYLRETVATPGGLTRFAVTSCIYACHNQFTGALMITVLALFFYYVFQWYMRVWGIRGSGLTGFIPAFILMTICAWYELSYCAYLLPVGGALALTAIYQRFHPKRPLASALFLSLLIWTAWYLLQWGCVLLMLFIIIFQFITPERKNWLILIAVVTNAVLLWVLNTWIVPINMSIRWIDFSALSGLPIVVISFFPFSAIIFALWTRFWPARARAATIRGIIVRILLLVCGTVVSLVWLCKDPVNRDTRTFARTIYHITTGQWDAVLHEKTGPMFAEFPNKGDALQAFMVHAVAHALCRTGQISDRLFAFPQKVFANDPLLMLQTTLTGGFVNWITVLELTMDLGMVNTAEKIAGELMENMGPFPDIIYRRALIHIAKGDYNAAAVYLARLSHMPFYGTKANRMLKIIYSNDKFESEPRIAQMRASMDTTDYFLFTVSPDAMLKHLLQSNPGNKIAYDYLMTYCIYNGWFEGLTALAPAAPAFGYKRLPRCWEEALCVNLVVSKEELTPSNVSFPGMRQATLERLNQFIQVSLTIGNDSIAAAKLAPAYCDSYFYFYMFKYSYGVYHE